MASLKCVILALIATSPLSLGVELDLRPSAPIPLTLNQRGQEVRDPRSLLNTFPFNQAEEHHEHHAEHPEPAVASADLEVSPSLQGSGVASFAEVAAADEGDDGKRCIEKVEMQEKTEYDEVISCDHSYDKSCHTTYVTTYESQQEEECDENFRKNCFIEYEPKAVTETSRVCRTPLVKDCDVEGPEVCRTEYESECWTKQEEHEVEDDVVECTTVTEEKCEDETSGYTTSTKCTKWPREECSVSKKAVTKFTPITGCTKEPRVICAPAGCGLTQGAEECYDKTQTIIQEAPKEQCSLEPQRTCKHVTKLVPKLEPAEECVDVPKEVCTRSKTNPQTVKTPVIKKWCYVPQPKEPREGKACLQCACDAMKGFMGSYSAFAEASASFSGDFEGLDKIIGNAGNALGGISPALKQLKDGVENFKNGFKGIDGGLETFDGGLKDLEDACGGEVETIEVEVTITIMVKVRAGYRAINSGVGKLNSGYSEISSGVNKMLQRNRNNPLVEPVKEGYSAMRKQFQEFQGNSGDLKQAYKNFSNSFHGGEDNSGLA